MRSIPKRAAKLIPRLGLADHSGTASPAAVSFNRIPQDSRARGICDLRGATSPMFGRDATSGQPLEDRFWPKVERRSDDECWPWRGATRGGGYGVLVRNRRTEDGRLHRQQIRATHVAWSILHGRPFPAGLMARHKCDNPRCVNPHHIVPGTARDNVQDMIERRRGGLRREKCPRGHPMHTYPSGRRGCKECRNEGRRTRPERIKRAATVGFLGRYVARQRAAAKTPYSPPCDSSLPLTRLSECTTCGSDVDTSFRSQCDECGSLVE
jgi:hypothetical protein